jgi:hypothetical protein
MAKIDSFDFGSIVVDGRRYVYDVLILPDGTVRERVASRARLRSHTITSHEIEGIGKLQPDIIVVGTGTSELASLSDNAYVYVKRSNLNLVLLPSPQAVEKFNQLIDEGKRVAALIHITC